MQIVYNDLDRFAYDVATAWSNCSVENTSICDYFKYEWVIKLGHKISFCWYTTIKHEYVISRWPSRFIIVRKTLRKYYKHVMITNASLNGLSQTVQMQHV